MSSNRLLESTRKIALLTFFTFLPLIINIIIVIIPAENIVDAISTRIVPGEMLAYCLSFIAPLFLFFLETHGKSFRIPVLKSAFIISFIIYLLALILTLIAKNDFINGIDFKPDHNGLYFWMSIIFVVFALLLRLYTYFHDSRYSDYKQTLDKQQQDFNNKFSKSI